MLQGNPFVSLLGMLVLIAAILFLAWWATKQIAQRPGLQGFGGRLPNGDMSVLAQIPLDSTLANLCDNGKIEEMDRDYLDVAATVIEHRLGLSE